MKRDWNRIKNILINRPKIKTKSKVVIVKYYKHYDIKRRKEISSCLKDINIIKLKKKENRFIIQTDQEGMFYLKLKGII